MILHMKRAKVIFRTIALLTGLAAFCGAGAGAYREWRGGPVGVVPVVILAPVVIAIAGILFTRWREFARKPPWELPAAVFAVCAASYAMSLVARIGLIEYGSGSGSSWGSFLLSLCGYIVIVAVTMFVTAFVYYGSLASLRSLRRGPAPSHGPDLK